MSCFLHRMLNVLMYPLQKMALAIANTLKKWFNRKESFTIMVVPHAPLKSVRSVRFSRWLISSFIVLNFIMFSVVCIFGISYYSLNIKLENKREEYQALQVLKDSEEKQLNEYRANETTIREKIEELKELEEKLKEIIKTKGGEPQSSSGSRYTFASRSTGSFDYQRSTYSVLNDFESFDNMYNEVDELAEEIDRNIDELNNAIIKAEEAERAQRAKPLVLPVYGKITSGFGYRRNPFGRGYEFHTGIDIANSKGTPIKASGDGIVSAAGWDGGYGYLVKINHQNGYESLYGHNSKILVSVGQEVTRGQVIAYMGSTGRSTGNHSHFEVRLNGKAINPYDVK